MSVCLFVCVLVFMFELFLKSKKLGYRIQLPPSYESLEAYRGVAARRIYKKGITLRIP